MDIETLREYCLAKKATHEGFPFDQTTLVFKVVDRMFAVIDLEQPDHMTLKCDPDYALELRDRYHSVEGAFHFNKKYWNQVALDGDVPDELLRRLIDHSYEEVLKKFTRKQKEAYHALS